jgi:hypothetical protein
MMVRAGLDCRQQCWSCSCPVESGHPYSDVGVMGAEVQCLPPSHIATFSVNFDVARWDEGTTHSH